MAVRLYHYTCDDSIRKIMADGFLRPSLHPLLNIELVWLTDLDSPTRADLGLTSDRLNCDRMRYRVVVDTGGAIHWPRACRMLGIRGHVRDRLESGCFPGRWWVALSKITVVSSAIVSDTAGPGSVFTRIPGPPPT
jgi:hypothetical protein